jgi:hypothetical protein
MRQVTDDNMECKEIIGILIKYEQWIDDAAYSTMEKLNGKQINI